MPTPYLSKSLICAILGHNNGFTSVNLLRSYFITTTSVTTTRQIGSLLSNQCCHNHSIRDRTILVERFTAAVEWIVSLHHFEKCGRTAQSYRSAVALSDKGLHYTALEMHYSEAEVNIPFRSNFHRWFLGGGMTVTKSIHLKEFLTSFILKLPTTSVCEFSESGYKIHEFVVDLKFSKIQDYSHLVGLLLG